MEILTKQNHRLININILKLITIVMTFVIITLITDRLAAAKNADIYKEGIYCYQITDEEKKEVRLVGIEPSEVIKELVIPGTATINEKQYTVSGVSISYDYYGKDELQKLYQQISKINIADNYIGELDHLTYAFPNLRTYEFYGNKPPKKVNEALSNRNDNLDILFLVPKGTESDYAKVITYTMNYSLASDLYEFDIPMTPTIVSEIGSNIEYGCFQIKGLIYQVTSSAKNEKGTVQLIGQNKMHNYSYLKLPSEVENKGYTYSLTKLNRNSLIASGAKVVVIPDSVAKMDSFVFDKEVELLFLSKNCKIIPNLITDENNESRLRFVSLPEGVTTINDRNYPYFMKYETSVILPTTIKTLGKKSLHDYKLVTFLNKKPIKSIASAIKAGTTVKVNKSAIKVYQAALGKGIKVIAAKNVVKSKKLSVNATKLTLNTSQIKHLKGTLTKGSNETVFWLSTNPNILEVSDKGVINPKKAGTTYVIAYTRTSGLHQTVKVNVTDN